MSRPHLTLTQIQTNFRPEDTELVPLCPAFAASMS